MTTITAQELYDMQEPEPSNWIVDGLLRSNRGRPSLLCGFPESGKSTLANQLAVDVANGTPFLGRETKQGHVILWKTEDSKKDAASDLRRAGFVGRNISVHMPYEGKATLKNNTAQLKMALAKYPDARLVIVETLGDFFDMVDSTNNDECRKALSKFRDDFVIPFPNTVFLILHHLGKSKDDADLSSKKILGGTAFVGGTDAKIYLRQVSDADPRRVIHVTIRRGKSIPPTYLKFDAATQRATLDDTVENTLIQDRTLQRKQKASDLKDTILQIVSDTPGLPTWTVVKMAGGTTAFTGAIVTDLIKANLILVRDAGGRSHAQLLYPDDYDFTAERAPENTTRDSSNHERTNEATQ
jgi:hypothetical protein